ncbi:glycoside hydrolase family 3 C-terminal domain-containing protein, partial [Bacteroides reticulotermitis]|uniref:glycoside hydrolase family 3 C-terminal domain-containing protein n=1 Tax=Bacteroides reticulotermitis TaxID=1133319 RepID=UPI003A8A07CA
QKEAIRMSINAGLDMHMYSADSMRFVAPLIELVQEKKVSQERIDDAVRRILKIKFELGLFENRYVSPEKDNYGSKENKDLALEAAREAIVLLKNKQQILPLDKNKYKKILVTGPNADNQSILGDWSIFQPDDHVTTILEGIQTLASPEQSITYSNSGRIKAKKSDLSVNTTDPAIQQRLITEGGGISDFSINDAVRKAKQADLAVVAIGGYGIRTEWGLRTYGESADRPSIDFYGRQLELVQAIYKTGTPIVIVIINGKPLNNEWITENIATIVDVWEPGMYGGQALAEILFGEVNPSGKLPITIPKHAGQIPMYYYQRPSRYWTGYGLGSSRADDKPAFCFGHGLSYSTYEYSDLKVDSLIPANKDVEVTFTVKNTGKMAGKETALLFVRDCVSSVVTPVASLKGFDKVSLEPGEAKEIRITIPYAELGLWNENLEYVVEPGKFNLMIGRSVEDIRIKKDFYVN